MTKKLSPLISLALIAFLIISAGVSGCIKSSSSTQSSPAIVQESVTSIEVTAPPTMTISDNKKKDLEALEQIQLMSTEIGPLVQAVKNDGMNSEWSSLKQDSQKLKARSEYWKGVLLEDSLYYQVSPDMGLILSQLTFALDDYIRGADYYIAGVDALNSGNRASAGENFSDGVERINQAERQISLTSSRLEKMEV